MTAASIFFILIIFIVYCWGCVLHNSINAASITCVMLWCVVFPKLPLNVLVYSLALYCSWLVSKRTVNLLTLSVFSVLFSWNMTKYFCVYIYLCKYINILCVYGISAWNFVCKHSHFAANAIYACLCYGLTMSWLHVRLANERLLVWQCNLLPTASTRQGMQSLPSISRLFPLLSFELNNLNEPPYPRRWTKR